MDSKGPTRILVVEDEIIIAKAIKTSLKNLGYDVIGSTSSGREAIEKAIQSRPDLVLMDIKLKGFVDGVLATQRIQTHLDIPVVYLTAHSDEETLKRVLHSKPYGYITKPFIEDKLHAAIEKALNIHKEKQNLAKRQER
jgi:DNA-binding NarL/FixJ family response regulator